MLKDLVSISIGEYYATYDTKIIYTLLGSCVAVCLFDTENKIGGMNHILMPGRPNLQKYDASARYGVNAMELLINAMMKLGGNRKKFVAKTFGGASVIPAISKDRAVGQKVAQFVMDFLETEKIKIISRDFGGFQTRKVYFHTDTNEVYVKKIVSLKSLGLLRKEKQKLRQVRKKFRKPEEIEIFK